MVDILPHRPHQYGERRIGKRVILNIEKFTLLSPHNILFTLIHLFLSTFGVKYYIGLKRNTLIQMEFSRSLGVLGCFIPGTDSQPS